MDNKSKALGYLVGRQIAGMRRVTTEPVAWLYNGVRLPKLPEWDREMYPYAVINKRVSRTVLKLSLYAENAYYFPGSTSGIYFGGDSEGENVRCVRYTIDTEANPTEWGEMVVYENNNSAVTGVILSDPIWANFNMEYEGTLYLEASEPVPVYE